MHMEFFIANWKTLISIFIPILGIVVAYWIYRRRKEEEIIQKLGNLEGRMSGVEKSIDRLYVLYPQLKSLEKLENFEKLNLTQEDISKTVSEILKTTNITPEAISTSIKEEVTKKFSDIDKAVATLVAQKINEVDKQFKKPVANASDYLILGNVEYDKKDYAMALNYYDKAIKIKPGFATAWNNKGIALGNLGRHKEALKAFDKAIEIKTDFASAWYNKGAALGNLGRYNEALKAFDKAIEIKPDYAKPWYNKACAYSYKGDKENALKNLLKAIEIDPKFKEKAKKDKNFENLWDDEDFKKIVR